MISKKDMLVLGLVAIGGIGVASSIASSSGGVTGGEGFRIKPFAGIVGSNKAEIDTGDNAGVTSIVLPPEPTVFFPKPPVMPLIPQMPTYSPSPVKTAAPSSVKSGGGSGSTKVPTFKATPSSGTITPLPANPSSRIVGTTAPAPTKKGGELETTTAPLGTSAAAMPVYNPYVRRSGGRSSRPTTTTTKSVSTSKKRPRSFGISARSLGGGWSTGY